MRSATAPATMVVAVAQNISWNSTKAISPAWLGSWSNRPNRPAPSQPPQVGPNIRPKPTSQKASAAMAKSATFLAATLIEFLLRVRPDSRHRKPACMTNTSAAHSTIHSRSSGSVVIGSSGG